MKTRLIGLVSFIVVVRSTRTAQWDIREDTFEVSLMYNVS